MDASAATCRRCLAVKGLRVLLLPFFFIALSLPSVSPPRRNDANRLIQLILAEFNAVGHQQQQNAVHRSDRLPAKFSAFNAILLYQSVGIGENMFCDLETNPMLSTVGFRFGIIPLEQHPALP